MKKEAKVAENEYREIFSKEVWGGMKMANISVHKNDLESEATYDPDDKLKPIYKDIRVEICVAGTCISTTLDNIIENNRKIYEVKKALKKYSADKSRSFIDVEKQRSRSRNQVLEKHCQELIELINK